MIPNTSRHLHHGLAKNLWLVTLSIVFQDTGAGAVASGARGPSSSQGPLFLQAAANTPAVSEADQDTAWSLLTAYPLAVWHSLASAAHVVTASQAVHEPHKSSPPHTKEHAQAAIRARVSSESAEGREALAKVVWATIAMVLGVIILSSAFLCHAKMHPKPFSERGYISSGGEHHAKDAPDTDDETDEVSAEAGPAGPPPKVFRQNSTYLETGHITVQGDELVNDIGISALVVFDPHASCGTAKLPNKIVVPLIAAQGMFLQLGLLYFMAVQLLPKNDGFVRDVPPSIIFVAVYLHFLNCIQELPYAWQIFKHITDFHDDWQDVALMGGILISDAFIVPLLSFVLGGLYLCTSRTIGDAILNAVAVAFIREIDNWILRVNTSADFLSGKIKSSTVNLPICRATMKKISWCAIFVPVVPVVATVGICWIGFNVLRL